MVARAANEIRESGAPASDALAKLVDELLQCRSRGLIWTLVAAKQATHTHHRLSSSIEAVLATNPIRSGHGGRFMPEIVGSGQVGLTDGSWVYVQKHAKEALARLRDQ